MEARFGNKIGWLYSIEKSSRVGLMEYTFCILHFVNNLLILLSYLSFSEITRDKTLNTLSFGIRNTENIIE